MDDNFIQSLKSFSKEVAQETQQQMFLPRPDTAAGHGGGSVISTESAVTTLKSYRPESAAFTFTSIRNRPGTGARRPPSSFRQREVPSIPEPERAIPSLEEVQEEDLTATVASAPSFSPAAHHLTLTELDAELSQTKALSYVDGVDLRKLCKFLVPERDLVETDTQWNWDRLYTEILSSPELSHLIRFDRNSKEGDKEGEGID